MADGPARKPRRRSHAFSTTLLVLAVLTTIAAGAFLYGASRYVDRLPTLDAIKAREIAEEKEAVEQYGSSDSGASLGDILGAALKGDK